MSPERKLNNPSFFEKKVSRRTLITVAVGVGATLGVAAGSVAKTLLSNTQEAPAVAAGGLKPTDSPIVSSATATRLPEATATFEPTATKTAVPTATLTPEPTKTAVPTATTKPTEVPTVSPTPDAAKKAEQLLKEAPQIPGLKAELKNGQITYAAQKDNQWGFKEGEVVGEVVEFEKAIVPQGSNPDNAKVEKTNGISLDPAIIKTYYLETNTPENLAQGKIQIPFPVRYKPGMVIYEGIVSKDSNFLGVNFNPAKSIIGTEVLSTFPIPTKAFRSANLNGTGVSISPDINYVPKQVVGWAISVYSTEFETTLRNDDHSIVAYGVTLIKITSEAKISSTPQGKEYQLAFLIGTKSSTDNRDLGFAQILNINDYLVFMR